MEMNNTVIYTYRYMWQTNKKGELNKTFVKIVSGSIAEHEQFVKMLKEDKHITLASRMYVCEYQVDKLDVPESIKTIKKEGEKNETSKDE